MHPCQSTMGLVLGLMLLLAQQHQLADAKPSPRRRVRRWQDCDADMQVVMCGQVPFEDKRTRRACCFQYREVALSPDTQAEKDAAQAAAVSIQANIIRPDLDALNPDMGISLSAYRSSACTVWVNQILVPTFSSLSNTAANIVLQNAPTFSGRPNTIKRIKDDAMAALAATYPGYLTEVRAMQTVNSISQFIHPGTPVGAAEIVLAKQKVKGQVVPSQPQLTAWIDGLINGTAVPPKVYSGPNGTWNPPRDCPVKGYGPDYSMRNVRIKYGGVNDVNIACPTTYPARAPTNICAHVSFVELDGTMAYRQALAHLISGDDQYLTNVIMIISAWMSKNIEWGIRSENGPLEAGWGIAAMAKALELLRNKVASGFISQFLNWVNPVLMTPQMDWYEDVILPTALKNNIPNVYGNWDSTIAEAMMAVAILSDDRTRYNKAVTIYHNTVKDYLRWGKDQWAAGRLPGECTETLRDLFHTQFGLGGLIQVAEMAWQQNDDVYSSNNYALVAAMETHARIIRAGLNRTAVPLPSGFRFYDTSMPKPPAGCRWQFDIRKQLWTAVNSTNGAFVSDLKDGWKYLVGIDFQPSGWEMGYNHFVGRLGLRMPETALLLQQAWPDYFTFHWGAGSLTHATSAWQLWRRGVTTTSLCVR